MDPKIDLAKVVGAASAPVALIIASCIYLGNMSAKYNNLFLKMRDLLAELRDKPEEERANSIRQQLHLYERRIEGTLLCTLFLNVAIICFILTVVCTGLGALLPDSRTMMVLTTIVMFLGVGSFVVAVIVEVWSNRLAKPTLQRELSMTAEYDPILPAHR